MTVYDLINEIGDLLNMLSKAVTAYSRRGEEKSKADLLSVFKELGYEIEL